MAAGGGASGQPRANWQAPSSNHNVGRLSATRHGLGTPVAGRRADFGSVLNSAQNRLFWDVRRGRFQPWKRAPGGAAAGFGRASLRYTYERAACRLGRSEYDWKLVYMLIFRFKAPLRGWLFLTQAEAAPEGLQGGPGGQQRCDSGPIGFPGPYGVQLWRVALAFGPGWFISIKVKNIYEHLLSIYWRRSTGFVETHLSGDQDPMHACQSLHTA